MATEGDATTLDESTVALNEVYESYVRAGFSADQALELIKVHLAKILQDYEDPK